MPDLVNLGGRRKGRTYQVQKTYTTYITVPDDCEIDLNAIADSIDASIDPECGKKQVVEDYDGEAVEVSLTFYETDWNVSIGNSKTDRWEKAQSQGGLNV